MQSLVPHAAGQRLVQHHHLSPATLTRLLPHISRTPVTCSAAASDPFRQLPQPIVEPLAYTKAFVDVTVRRLAEAALDTAAEVSMQLAEQPQRMREFADEVQAAADRELQSSGQQQRLLSTTSSGSGQGSSTAGNNSSGRQDLEALVDDLRADIAASRALLQQIRAVGSITQAPPSRL